MGLVGASWATCLSVYRAFVGWLVGRGRRRPRAASERASERATAWPCLSVSRCATAPKHATAARARGLCPVRALPACLAVLRIVINHFVINHPRLLYRGGGETWPTGSGRVAFVSAVADAMRYLLPTSQRLIRPALHPLRSAGIRSLSGDAGPAAILWLAAACTGAWTLAEGELIAHGRLEPGVSLLVGPSRVPNAGRGVFAGQDLPAGTLLGSYPGRRLSAPSYYAKRQRLPNFTEYCWVIEELQIALDPTDEQTGTLCEPLSVLSPLPIIGTIETTLALINEPPPSADVNLVTTLEGKTLSIATGRAIAQGDELYLDCACEPSPSAPRTCHVRQRVSPSCTWRATALSHTSNGIPVSYTFGCLRAHDSMLAARLLARADGPSYDRSGYGKGNSD
jgi:hypothetical protein